MWWSMASLTMAALMLGARADKFVIGYLTGSQRRRGDFLYDRPGLMISGAISLAVEEVNTQLLGPMGHSLEFEVAETYGDEETSIRQTALLWSRNVSAYIGPQETCVHEGRMAAAFNLPMISYYCTDHETSDKRQFPTFARTRPPETQISKSVAALLLHFNWTHVAFLYLNAPDADFSKVAFSILETIRSVGVIVPFVRSWKDSYHYGYTKNPFLKIIQETFEDTRIYVTVGNYYDHIGFMLAMDEMKLLEKGDYFVVGVDTEQYGEADPARYLRGLLRSAHAPRSPFAFRSYLAVVPSPARAFRQFTTLVNKYMEMPPFNFPNPLKILGGQLEIRPEAAYLYDAVWLYARALVATLHSGGDPHDGVTIAQYTRGTHTNSAMGYMVYMDANGDAEGNYTLLGLENTPVPGLYPVGGFRRHSINSSSDLPELRLVRELRWPGGRPPRAEPPCGFRGERCISHSGEIAAGVAGGALLALALVALALYRSWRYEQELDSLLWRLEYRDIKLAGDEQDKDKSNKGETQTHQRVTRAMHPLIRTSQVSLSSNPDADFRYSSIFTEIGIYRGRVLALKRVRKRSIDITREMKKELKTMRDLRHDNLNGFVGACIEPPNVCVVSEYCTRGSLKDILENEDVKLDNMFIASLVGDIIRGMLYIHESPLRWHGALRPSNCLVDSRWVVKLADFGLHNFRQGEESPSDPTVLQAKVDAMVYLPPERLRAGASGIEACTPAGDVYAFALVLYEMHARRGPFGPTDLSSAEIVQRVAAIPTSESPPFRPSLEPLESSFDFVRDCASECWAETPTDRPDFKAIRAKLRPLRKGMKPNIFDNMMAMMEKYANNLEALVDERTDQLQEEKKKTEALLLEMLPRSVAEQLKRGRHVDPESFDCVTIYFSDIVGFTAMSAESTPLQVVDFLNDLYTCFDSIIENYDVYKVETIGDAYMVVSGVPLRNTGHAGEVASMALALLRAVRGFRVRHRPQQRLLLRVGLHSGPVCAGVVGLKMPRYCLFGDTVNTASRMESTGAPLKIHCSASCKRLLDELGGYYCEERGLVAMKGKHDQLTYWLRGEDTMAAAQRAQARAARRKGGDKVAVQVNENNKTEQRGQRSSLKKHITNRGVGLHRCSSLESPKKLRFASGNLLEFYNYNIHHHRSDEYLMEVLGDANHSPKKKATSLMVPETCGHASSCPCIKHTEDSTLNPVVTAPPPASSVPLLFSSSQENIQHPNNVNGNGSLLEKSDDRMNLDMKTINKIDNCKDENTCEIKLMINGFNYDCNDEQQTPLLVKI